MQCDPLWNNPVCSNKIRTVSLRGEESVHGELRRNSFASLNMAYFGQPLPKCEKLFFSCHFNR